MSIAHYMYRPPTLDADTFAKFASDVKAILSAVPPTVVLCGRDGSGRPEANSGVVVLNGDRANGEDHEPLIIEQKFTLKPPSRIRDGVFFDFCKTSGKPYDRIVVAVLYAFIYRFPACRFVSDSTLAQLKPGFDLFFNVCHPSNDVQRLYERPLTDRQVVE